LKSRRSVDANGAAPSLPVSTAEVDTFTAPGPNQANRRLRKVGVRENTGGGVIGSSVEQLRARGADAEQCPIKFDGGGRGS
jgi:hypothetical protein